MMHSAASSKMPWTGRSKSILVFFLILSFFGFLDATYLTVEHYRPSPIPCLIFQGCTQVTTSQYSIFFGIPVALFGVFYYFTLFVLSLLALDRKNPLFLKRAAWLTPLGFLASGYFLFIQAFVLHAFCSYCLLSATISTLLFIFGMIFLRLYP